MKKPFVGAPVSFRDYFAGSFGTHMTGLLGGMIWGAGTSLNLIASGRAGFAISALTCISVSGLSSAMSPRLFQ